MINNNIEGAVLVPVDFSQDSLQAVKTAMSMLATAADLHIVTVLKPSGGSSGADEGMLSHLRNELERALDDEVMNGAHLHVCVGDPGRQICAVAGETDASLIVIPAHGQDATGGIGVGSVTERVVRLAPCPVLVVGKR